MLEWGARALKEVKVCFVRYIPERYTAVERDVTDLLPRTLAFMTFSSFQITTGAEEWLPMTWRSDSNVNEASSCWTLMIAPDTESTVATERAECLARGTE